MSDVNVSAEATPVTTEAAVAGGLLDQVVAATKQTEPDRAQDLVKTLVEQALAGTVTFDRNLPRTIDRAIAATQKASAHGHEAPEIQCAEAWVLFAEGRYDAAADKIRLALGRAPDLDGGYYLLGRALFSAGRYQEVADIMEDALAHAGENYNTTIPIHNSLGALGKTDALKNYIHREIAIYEEHLKKVPEDARARVLLAADYAKQDRFEEAKREADMAMILRPCCPCGRYS